MSSITSRSLSPSSPPFIFPKSSPTFTSNSSSNSDNTSSGTISSTCVETSSTSSHSDTTKAKDNTHTTIKGESTIFPFPSSRTTTAKSFGAGWKSSSSTSPFNLIQMPNVPGGHHTQRFRAPVCDKGPFDTRSRSPSLPILPSQSHTPTIKNFTSEIAVASAAGTNQHPSILYPINTKDLSNDFELYTPTSPNSAGHPFSPINDHIHHVRHHPSLSSIDIELDDHPHTHYPYRHHASPDANGCSFYPPMGISPISHHQSVPNLPYHHHYQGQAQSLFRKPSVNVRFQDDDTPTPLSMQDINEAEAEGEIEIKRGLRRMPAFNFGQMGARNKLMSSKSMPAMPILGEGRNVFIHRVNSDLTEDQLRVYASEFGEVVSVKIPSRTTRPHAFVMFKRPDQAQSFIVHLKMKNVECEFGKEDYQVQNKALEDPNSANLYIAGLPTALNYEELAELLSPAKICSWKPLVDEAGNRRGPIMARLQTRVQANDVIKKINGKYYQGMSERIQARIADSDEQKHFKRHQSMSRDRPIVVPPVQFRPYGNVPQDEGDDLELLRTRDYLASQLDAINGQLARTQVRPRNIVFPDPEVPIENDIVRPSPVPIGQIPRGWGHRHTSSNFSIDSLGSWPDWTSTWTRNPPNQNNILAFGGNLGHPQPHPQLRQQSLSLTNHHDNEANFAALSPLHHVKSSPELGGRSDSASKLLWKKDEV
ncbi:hypothetical protein I203_107226 [Kwoniella mangroviensis CBS 8507]|uniref:hypothetical protein n=1 Tax=Kwoniella mangroviensis CBS 8507 TaxID=1296122 RepID=UPI00080D3040|nr:uncharacterized protein I203_01974 [Kwoniella mangroviensis CBS 8507]OCF68591.1 hypothetical protein I203_01974 [Kwoniella mangroviensis CBS 8507]